MKLSNKRVSTAAACSIAVLLSACGGSGTDGYNQQQNQPKMGAASQSTANLDVPALFDWSNNKQIRLSLVLHDVSGELAANTRVSVFDMPQSPVDDDREPTDFEIQQVAKIFSGHTDNEGRRETTDSDNTALYTENGAVKDFEIHLPNHQPIQGQDVSMFGTGDDASNGVDRFYVSKNNLPWVLNVPYQIYYPQEYVDIGMAYPEFSQWVASGGSQMFMTATPTLSGLLHQAWPDKLPSFRYVFQAIFVCSVKVSFY